MLQCKFLHRVYWTKVRLARIYDDIDPTCDRCRQAPANLLHMFWTCPALQSFWSAIFDTISDVLLLQIDPSPIISLFGVLPENTRRGLRKYQYDFVAFVTLLARRLILMHWKKRYPPSHSRWISDILHFLKLEKIKYTLRGSISKFRKVWQPFLNYVDLLALEPPNEPE